MKPNIKIFDSIQMKRIISALIISVLAAACSKEISLTPGISFLTPAPEVFEETALFRIVGQPFTAVDTLKIPVTFSGTARKGEDYEASAEYFILTKESLIDTIVVSTRKLGTGRTVGLNLQIPEGFVAGKYPTSEFTLQDKFGFLTFEMPRSFVADTTSYAIVLCDSTGRAKALSKETPVSFSVNTEKSTAVEGVDFEITSSTNAAIPAGAAYAVVDIVPLKSGFAEGKDKVVLDILADDKFETGLDPELEITLIRPQLQELEGNWMMDSIVTDSLHFETVWGADCTGYDLLPGFYSYSMVGFSLYDATFSPSLAQGFENYFLGLSSMTMGPEMEIIDAEGNPKTVQLISLDKTNRYFSETEVSEDTVSYVGVHLYDHPEDQSKMIDLYILDHTSKSFMPELEAGNRYGAEKPVAAQPGFYLCATFAKY